MRKTHSKILVHIGLGVAFLRSTGDCDTEEVHLTRAAAAYCSRNRNLDLCRQFHAQLEESGIAWTSILNGGFMGLLGPGSQMVNHKSRKVTYVGKATQLLDFTSMADTVVYTASVATDSNPTPNYIRIAGDVVSVQDIAKAETEVEDTTHKPSSMGSVWILELMIRLLRLLGGEDQIFPA